MTWRRVAMVVLGVIFASALLADFLAPHPYEEQFREAPLAPPSGDFPMGTDEMGRDRLSRLIHGARVSLLLAPAAALLTTLLATALGLLTGYVGGFWKWVGRALTDLFLSLPWLFLLLMVRATLPLNTSPGVSLVITFALLGLLGWAAAARLIASSARGLRDSDFLMQAMASGQRPWRLLLVHGVPNLRPVLAAQFWLALPVGMRWLSRPA